MSADLLPLVRAFDDAERRGDTERLDAMLTDDFMSIGDQGFLLDKRRWLDVHAEFGYLSLETTELDVRCYDRAAIVRGVRRGEASWRGEAMTLTVRSSQTWVELREGWRLAGIQFSTLT